MSLIIFCDGDTCIGILYKLGLAVTFTVNKSETMEIYTHFENIDYTQNIGMIKIEFVIICHPRPSKQNGSETLCSLMNDLNT